METGGGTTRHPKNCRFCDRSYTFLGVGHPTHPNRQHDDVTLVRDGGRSSGAIRLLQISLRLREGFRFEMRALGPDWECDRSE